MMLADDPTATGFTRPQLTCAYQLMDRLPSDAERCRCLINAVSQSLGLNFTRTISCMSDRSQSIATQGSSRQL